MLEENILTDCFEQQVNESGPRVTAEVSKVVSYEDFQKFNTIWETIRNRITFSLSPHDLWRWLGQVITCSRSVYNTTVNIVSFFQEIAQINIHLYTSNNSRNNEGHRSHTGTPALLAHLTQRNSLEIRFFFPECDKRNHQ